MGRRATEPRLASNTVANKGKDIGLWEAEFWEALCKGDGDHCPLYHSCLSRYDIDQCIEHHRESIKRMCQLMSCELNIHKGREGDLIKVIDMLHYVVLKGLFIGSIITGVMKLSEEYLRRANVEYPPVPSGIVSIVDNQKPVEIIEVPLRSYGAALWELSDSRILFLNSNIKPEQRRFFLFHELFHILAHCRCTCIGACGQGYLRSAWFNEFLADLFSMYVLMPTNWINNEWSKSKNLAKMSKLFSVPKSLVWLRLQFEGVGVRF